MRLIHTSDDHGSHARWAQRRDQWSISSHADAPRGWSAQRQRARGHRNTVSTLSPRAHRARRRHKAGVGACLAVQAGSRFHEDEMTACRHSAHRPAASKSKQRLQRETTGTATGPPLQHRVFAVCAASSRSTSRASQGRCGSGGNGHEANHLTSREPPRLEMGERPHYRQDLAPPLGTERCRAPPGNLGGTTL